MTKSAPGWLLLIHQLPPKPAYLRVKIGRHLARIGAVALKNTVYAMPRSNGAMEHLQWIRREITDGGGDGALVEARLVEGLSDEEVQSLFRSARDTDYQAVAEQARALRKGLGRRAMSAERRAELEPQVARLERRLEEIATIDFFAATAREGAVGLVGELRQLATPDEAQASVEDRGPLKGRTWVTRAGVHVDRIGSAWLIRRFIDPEARFKFVAPTGYVPEAGELRFDMFEAEYTHEGDHCTFEVLIGRIGLNVPGLRALAEVVHDIDLRDDKFARAETPGFAGLIAGTAMRLREDESRLDAGFALFDSLLAFYAKRKTGK